MKTVHFSCIIPTILSDYLGIRKHIYSLFDMLSIDKLIFIGPEELEKHVYEDSKALDIIDSVSFINENDIIPFSEIKNAYDSKISYITSKYGKPKKIYKAGWYYQQFLKLSYYTVCNDAYYLSWDADTIPLKRIEMFNESGLPYMDIKTEYTKPYFDTIRNLFGFGKAIDKSFISEHMLFKTEYVAEMINEIMATSLPGNTYYDKIFSAVEQLYKGFSEFETYGTWVAMRHPDSYRLRNWKSLRNTNFLINRNDVTDEDLNWLATGFDAASFEGYQKTLPGYTELFRNPDYRSKLTADVFYNELLEMGVFGEYVNGGIRVGDDIYPI